MHNVVDESLTRRNKLLILLLLFILFNYPRSSDLAKQAAEIFGFFAGSSSEHMNKEQFRALFLASGEEITSESEFDGLFAEVDGNDRDAKISLDEFTEWFKKDDSYEYSMRTKPLRDMKERLKNPAFYRSLQYFMGKNQGSNDATSTLNNGPLLNIDLGVKVGKMAQQTPAWGFDLKIEPNQNPTEQRLSFEFIYKENADAQQIISNFSKLASIVNQFAPGIGPADAPTQISIDGHPGIRITIPIQGSNPIAMMAPMFLTFIKDLQIKLHTSQNIDDIDTNTVMLDAGLKFQGQRSAFQMLGAIVVGQMGVDQHTWSLLALMQHVTFSLGFESLNNILEGRISRQISPEKIKAAKTVFSKAINRAVQMRGVNLESYLDMPVKFLHKIELHVANSQISFTGINLDVSFLFTKHQDNTPTVQINQTVPEKVNNIVLDRKLPFDAWATYPYKATNSNELSIETYEELKVIELTDYGWWKCQKKDGSVGLVPGNYLQELIRARVMHDFGSSNSLDLAPLKRGDILIVRHKDDNGWWKCQKDEKMGMVPSSYLQEITTDSILCRAEAIENFIATSDSEISLKVGDIVTVWQKDEGIKNDRDQGWWEVEKDGRRGWVSGSFLKEVPLSYTTATTINENVSSGSAPVQIGSATSNDEMRARALYDYEAMNDDEISFREREILIIKSKMDNGWWEAQNATGKRGWAPSNYLEEIK